MDTTFWLLMINLVLILANRLSKRFGPPYQTLLEVSMVVCCVVGAIVADRTLLKVMYVSGAVVLVAVGIWASTQAARRDRRTALVSDASSAEGASGRSAEPTSVR